MTALVCLAQSDADGYGATVDARMGYPRPGLDCPGGVHQVGGGVTTHYGTTQKHPTLAQWAYEPYDGTVQAQAVALPLGATVQTLDATWAPVAAVQGAQVG